MGATERQKQIAWEKARMLRGKDPDLYRRDRAGNVMYWPSYGKHTPMGWEVDHSHPRALGGTDSPRNIQALNTAENRRKGDRYPWWWPARWSRRVRT